MKKLSLKNIDAFKIDTKLLLLLKFNLFPHIVVFLFPGGFQRTVQQLNHNTQLDNAIKTIYSIKNDASYAIWICAPRAS